MYLVLGIVSATALTLGILKHWMQHNHQTRQDVVWIPVRHDETPPDFPLS